MAGKMGGFGHDDFLNMNFSRDPVVKLASRGAGAFLFIWVINALLGGALVGLVVYVAWHFISKAW